MIHPKITVITPTLNTGESIETALLSVANQTYKNIEHIIIDGASKDKTLPTIRRYQKMYKNIRLLTEKDTGIYDAMNKGMDMCIGDWIYFMGADDAFYNEQVLTGLFEHNLFQEEQVVYGNVIIKGDSPWAKDGSIYDGPFTLEKLFRWNICHQSIFYPKSVIRQVGYFETRYKVTSDWDYNIRCWARYKFTYADKIIAFFTSGGKSSEGGDYTLHIDFPNNVIKYFQLDVLDSNLHLATSPFYYPIARYRENEYINNIRELNAETGRLNQHIADQHTEHTKSVTALQKQYELSSAAFRSEFDEILANLRAEQENVLSTLREEHGKIVKNLKVVHDHEITNLKEEHDLSVVVLKSNHIESVSTLKNGYEDTIKSLQVEHDLFVATLKSDHLESISTLKNGYEEAIKSLQVEHDLFVATLKAGHLESVSTLKNGYEEAIKTLQVEHDLFVASLKSDHLESISSLKNGYENIIKSQQAEQRAFWDISQQRETEFMQVIESNNQHIEYLKLTMASNEQHFRETAEKYNEEILNLNAEIFAKKQEIATIFNSYTWKTGKILLAPSVFIAKKINTRKK
jgi:glycosyltransferase involved in cell wall biosynthesis